MTYNDRIIQLYSECTLGELHDLLDEARDAIRKADQKYMQFGLRSDRDAMETASIRFYNLQMVIRSRSDGTDNISGTTAKMAKTTGAKPA